MHISKKIKIHIDEKTKEKVDAFKLMQSIVFFASDIFEKHEDKFDLLMFHLVNKDDKGSQGCFFVHEKELHFVVDSHQIEMAVQSGFTFSSFKKSLFFVLLHEIGHGIDLLDKYNYRPIQTLETFHDEGNEKIKAIYDEFSDLTKMEISREIPEEIFADRFAYKNLSYFENLYDFDGFLI